MSWEAIALVVLGYCCFCWYLEYREMLEFIDDPKTKEFASKLFLPGETVCVITVLVLAGIVFIAPITKPYWWCRSIPLWIGRIEIWRLKFKLWRHKRRNKAALRRIRHKLIEVGYSREQAEMMTDTEAKWFARPKQESEDAFEEVYMKER